MSAISNSIQNSGLNSILNSKAAFRRFNLCNLIYTLGVILWGAYVRASSSGAGCGAHWPLCNGEVIPTPDRIQTWIEFAHRATSGISLSLVIIGFFWARHLSEKKSRVSRIALLTVIAIFLEAALGAGLVLLHLVEFDQSAARAISIALHLVNTLFLLASVTTLNVESRRDEAYRASENSVFPRNPLFLWTLFAFVCLGVTGAITALGDTLFPATSLLSGMQDDLKTGAHFLLKLRVIHPILATLWILLVFVWSKNLETIELRQIRALLILSVIVQFTFGLVNWMLMAPTALQLIHLLIADLVFITFFISGLKYEARESRLQA